MPALSARRQISQGFLQLNLQLFNVQGIASIILKFWDGLNHWLAQVGEVVLTAETIQDT